MDGRPVNGCQHRVRAAPDAPPRLPAHLPDGILVVTRTRSAAGGAAAARAGGSTDVSGEMRVGILTAGGDSPGLNAAIRGFGKAAIGRHGMRIVGFRDGFRGLAEGRERRLDSSTLAGVLTVGGTILGTSRDKPHRMAIDGEIVDMTDQTVAVYRKARLDALVCVGGGGTAKNALHLVRAGLRVVTIPKTIDNDLAETDATIGFATALEIATDAVDRLHSTAHSHHRIIVAEVMGHRAGWLTLGAGLASGADVILIPEIPYRIDAIVRAIRRRTRAGTNFSIVAVAEGARDIEAAATYAAALARRENADTRVAKAAAGASLAGLDSDHTGHSLRLARELEQLTGLESRVTILGYVQRGGTPSQIDRLLATRLGRAAADLVAEGASGVMVAAHGDGTRPVPLELVAGRRRTIPLDHSWVGTARDVGTCLGD
jgi:ATP-dependent phosphofructokinase / diphosphate-dependent phosphofructokinase